MEADPFVEGTGARDLVEVPVAELLSAVGAGVENRFLDPESPPPPTPMARVVQRVERAMLASVENISVGTAPAEERGSAVLVVTTSRGAAGARAVSEHEKGDRSIVAGAVGDARLECSDARPSARSGHPAPKGRAGAGRVETWEPMMLENLQALAADHPTLISWLATGGAALVAALSAAIAYGQVWNIASRLARHRVFAATVLRLARRSGRVVVMLLALQLVWDAAPEGLPRVAAVEHFTSLALTIAFAWLGVRCIAALAEAVVATHPLTVADNLAARRVQTQTRLIARILIGIVLFLGIALSLMSFPAVRSIGTSLLASAGIAGVVVGLAARPALGNLIAGLQLALTQPIRLDDIVIVEGEWGRIEEIGGSYVVVRIWDQRSLVIPLQWFLEHPFQNWTRTSAEIIGTVVIWADYRLPLAPVTAELERLCGNAPEWDRRVCVLQVTDAGERAMQLRALVSSADSSLNWDLRCKVRAGLVTFIQAHYPDCLPRARVQIDGDARRSGFDVRPS